MTTWADIETPDGYVGVCMSPPNDDGRVVDLTVEVSWGECIETTLTEEAVLELVSVLTGILSTLPGRAVTIL